MAVATSTALLAGAGLIGAGMDARNQRKAIESAESQRAASQAFIEKAIKQARGDLFKLYPEAQKARQQGLEAGMSIYGQMIPQQLEAFQAGNLGAQNTVLGGMTPQINAIMGDPLQMGGLQAMQIPTNFQMPVTPQLEAFPQMGLQAPPQVVPNAINRGGMEDA